jgi:hypothetical protein
VIEEFDDAAMVTDVVISLAKKEVYRPSLALIREAVHKREADKAPGLRELPWVRQELPPWVKRWFYARFRASPPDMRSFREQYPDVTDPPKGEWMPPDAYEQEAQEIKFSDVQSAFSAGKYV